MFRGKPTVLGFCSGAVAGLVVITPATGFVNANGAVIIGLLAGSVPFLACTWLKNIFKYDDALDTFGVHGVGGTLGALMTGILATTDVNARWQQEMAHFFADLGDQLPDEGIRPMPEIFQSWCWTRMTRWSRCCVCAAARRNVSVGSIVREALIRYVEGERAA